MKNEIPPIVKLAEQMLFEVELAVVRFPRRHKYVLGQELRQLAWKVAQLAHRAWRDRRRQMEWVSRLSFAIDDLKLSLQLGSRVNAFASFSQFEALARLASNLGKQCGGWQKRQHSQGQNATDARDPKQRAQILSARAASSEARA